MDGHRPSSGLALCHFASIPKCLHFGGFDGWGPGARGLASKLVSRNSATVNDDALVLTFAPSSVFNSCFVNLLVRFCILIEYWWGGSGIFEAHKPFMQSILDSVWVCSVLVPKRHYVTCGCYARYEGISKAIIRLNALFIIWLIFCLFRWWI